ncbi:insulinase family protein [Streptomonospora wellingtoniae]|uniref:Insulinase family protein n=1 Tax=Streptomonospora wellingtoniae TaxID=3075544 RepID=A0ABU2KP18_9ACTN|nr:insulinase family protein [Streptomonospora sp. DSM 45055]MDT0300937.1 insulinase family protein [Streptomonospora sp. DSM 45055]
MPPEHIHRYALSNGLRVVLAPDSRTPRVGVAVHYGVGFRSEEPGHAGFAHLLEHLMFRGSRNLPDGRFHDHIVQSFGESGGTTRQDYTEYFQKVPVGALEAALFAEADRMRAPLFTTESLRDQLRGIQQEIEDAIHGDLLGDLAWPSLPAAAYRTWSNAHNGYGRPEDLAGVTPDQCAAFFHRHYTPGNAVLTVTGDFARDRVVDLVDRHFGDIGAHDPSPLGLPATEPAWTADQWHTGTQPGLPGAAVAFAHRLSSPREDLDGYLSHMLVAELLTEDPVELPGASPARVDSSCGFFEPLDTLGPDTLVTTARLPAAEHAAPLLAGLRDRATGIANTRGTGKEAAARIIQRHHREHADPMRLARSLGRTELLLGDAELLHRIPERLDAAIELLPVTARRIGSAHAAALVLVPGARRERPTHRSEPEAPTARRSAAPAGAGSSRALAPPALIPQTSDVAADVFDTAVDTRLRLVGARDARVPLVELRLRIPLGERVWARPGREGRLVHALQIRLSELGGPAPGTSLELDTDGQWLRAVGAANPDRVQAWLTRLGAVLAGPSGTWNRLPPARPPQSPYVFADVAIRALALAGVETTDEEPVAAPAPDGALLVAVGPVDPEKLRVMVLESFSAWWARAPDKAVEHAPREPNGEPLFLPGRGRSAHLTLWTPQPAGIPSAASLHLAIAALGGHPASRLITAALRQDGKGAIVYAGYDWMGDRERVFIRSSQPREGLEASLSTFRRELRRLADDPPCSDELAGVVDYCTAQIPVAFDSPNALADMLAAVVGGRFGARWPTEAVAELRSTSADQVREAAGLLGRADFQAVAVVPQAPAGTSGE